MTDVEERTDLLEEILIVPHCEAHHNEPNVHVWAGDCTHTVVATFTDCIRSGGICLNTVVGAEKMRASGRTCKTCGNLISNCWKITPL